MKKLLSIVLCAATASAFADGPAANEAELGTVGVTAITTSLSNAIVAVSYDDLAGGSGIVVSNFVKTTNLTTGDQLAVFTNGVYSTWKLEQKGDTGPKYWAKNEKEFTVDSDGKLEAGTGTAAADVAQAVGTGIWLVRKNPKDDKDAPIPFYIYGKPASNPTSTVVANKWNLVGNPTQSEAQVGFAGTITDGDMIVIPIVPAGALCRYTYHKGKTAETTGWRKVNSKDQWEYGLPDIQPGLGFWIQTKEAVSLNWSVANED